MDQNEYRYMGDTLNSFDAWWDVLCAMAEDKGALPLVGEKEDHYETWLDNVPPFEALCELAAREQ